METAMMINNLETVLQSTTGAEAYRLLSETIKALKSTLARECAKSTGRLNVLKAMNNICRDARGTARAGLWFTWKDASGRQCACDGYRAMRLNPGHHVQTEERPEQYSGEVINLDRIFDGLEVKSTSVVPVPSAADIKMAIKTQRAIKGRKSRAILELQAVAPEGSTYMIRVNAEYLLDLVMATGTDHVYASPLQPLAPLYYRDDTCDAVILPIR